MKNFFKNKKNLIFTAVFLIILFCLCNSTFIAVIHNSFTIRRLIKKSASLDKQYEVLSKKYEEILSGKENYIEDSARVKYHMAKPEEFEFRIKK